MQGRPRCLLQEHRALADLQWSSGAVSRSCGVTRPREHIPPRIIGTPARAAHGWQHGAVASVALPRVTGRREWETEAHTLPPRLRLFILSQARMTGPGGQK